MAQNYHDEIRAALAAQGINNQTPQDVRDRAILAHNQSRGRDPIMRLFGARNEGIAPAQSAQVAAQSPQTAPQMQQSQQLPAQAPIPQARPMDAAIDATLGDDVPVPSPRPVMQDGLEGDAQAMEYFAAKQQSTPQSDIATAVDEADAASQTAPETAQVEPEDAVAQDAADATAGLGENAANLINAVIMLGGTAAAGALYQRYLQGDPDAMRTFAAVGMDPDDFSMFAGEASSAYDNRTRRLPAPNEQLEAPRLALPAPDPARFGGDPIGVNGAVVPMDGRGWPKGTESWEELIKPTHRAVAPTQRADEEKPRQRVPARTRKEGDEKPRVRAKAPRIKR